MAINVFQSALSLLQIHGYLLIFVLMIIEGPIVTASAAFAASLGLFSLKIIFILSIIGNLIPDIIFFFIGRFTRGGIIERYLGYAGLDKKRILKIENGLKAHAGKTLVFAKLTPLLPVPGIILAGFARVPFKRFFAISSIFNLTSSILFTLIGFYFGVAFNNVSRYFKWGEYSLFFLGLFILVVFTAWKIAASKLRNKINQIDPI